MGLLPFMQIQDLEEKIQELRDLIAEKSIAPLTFDQALLQVYSSIEDSLQSKQFSQKCTLNVTGSAAFKEENKSVTVLINHSFMCGKNHNNH